MRMVDFSGGKKWKKVGNMVGESKSTKLSIWYYGFLFEYVAGLVGRAVPRKVPHPLTTTSDDPWFTKPRDLPQFDGNGTGKSPRENISKWYYRIITGWPLVFVTKPPKHKMAWPPEILGGWFKNQGISEEIWCLYLRLSKPGDFRYVVHILTFAKVHILARYV